MTRSEQARLLQRKASQDLTVLDKLLDDPAIDDETLGYHAQQAAEKLIKALLALHGHDSRAATTSVCCSICWPTTASLCRSNSRHCRASRHSGPCSEAQVDSLCDLLVLITTRAAAAA